MLEVLFHPPFILSFNDTGFCLINESTNKRLSRNNVKLFYKYKEADSLYFGGVEYGDPELPNLSRTFCFFEAKTFSAQIAHEQRKACALSDDWQSLSFPYVLRKTRGSCFDYDFVDIRSMQTAFRLPESCWRSYIQGDRDYIIYSITAMGMFLFVVFFWDDDTHVLVVSIAQQRVVKQVEFKSIGRSIGFCKDVIVMLKSNHLGRNSATLCYYNLQTGLTTNVAITPSTQNMLAIRYRTFTMKNDMLFLWTGKALLCKNAKLSKSFTFSFVFARVWIFKRFVAAQSITGNLEIKDFDTGETVSVYDTPDKKVKVRPLNFNHGFVSISGNVLLISDDLDEHRKFYI